MNCRHCQSPLEQEFLDLGFAPLSNAFISFEELRVPELHYPLRLYVCEDCRLVQTEDYARASELFRPDYAYFSSTSASWLDHAARYSNMITDRLKLDGGSFVIEIASNDGYLLKNFVAAGIPCLGIEPTKGTADVAKKRGIPIINEFYGKKLGERLAQEGPQADLMVANNVLAHVPHINDFVKGFAVLLKPTGVATFEFPHLMRLVEHNQFDTIYHEHFSYLSFTTLVKIFEANGLSVFDVEELVTHGGSLRVFAQKPETGKQPISSNVSALLGLENAAGMNKAEYYRGFQDQANKVKNDFLGFLLDANSKGHKVCGYGAAAKGNTLLNFAGARPDLLPYIVDRNPAKQGKFMPGSRIPVVKEDMIREQTPKYVVILPWNIKDEIMHQLAYIRQWGGQFVTAVPDLKIH